MIRIVTDSAADLTAEQLSVPGIFVVPLSVTFADGTTQLDDGTMTKDEFFVRLAEDSKLPRTSQPSPASFMQVYEDAAAAGDEVLVITIGQKLSGTYQCAHLAAADVGLQAHIVDSEAASQAEALPEGVRTVAEKPRSLAREESKIALTTDRETHLYDGVFIFRTAVPLQMLLDGLETDGGAIRVDRNMKTSLPGVFAAGDVTGRPLQIAKAVGEGNVAAIAAAEYIAKLG